MAANLRLVQQPRGFRQHRFIGAPPLLTSSRRNEPLQLCIQVMDNIYRPLLGNEVRFVRIHPGAWTDPIQCDLVYLPLPNNGLDSIDVWFSNACSSSSSSSSTTPSTTSKRSASPETTPTDDVPSYVALSYVWGDPDDLEELLLNGNPVQKTVNLIVALRQLRALLGDPHHAPKYFGNHRILFWVDALCIDQSNMMEKSMQVPRMGLIYTSAELVVAWVGHSVNDGIRELTSMVNNLDIDEHSRLSEIVWPAVNSLDEDELSDVVRGLEGLLQRPWFERVWVVQEAVMAKQILLLAASHWCPYHHLEQVLIATLSIHGNHPIVRRGMWTVVRILQYSDSRNAIFATVRAICQKRPVAGICASRDTTGGREAYVYYEFLGAHIYTIRRSGASIFYEWVEQAYRLSKNAEDAKELFRTRLFAFILRNVLSSMRTTFLATIPHDYLYGVLSIGGSLGYPKVLAPDYTLPFATVFHNYTIVILLHTGSVSVIPRRRRQLQGVPSWVPDFRSERAPLVITQIDAETALSANQNVRIVENGRVCITRGVCVDDVMLVVSQRCASPDEDTPYGVIIRFDELIGNACETQFIQKDEVLTELLDEFHSLMKFSRSIWALRKIYKDCISGKLGMSNRGNTSQRSAVDSLASLISTFPLFISLQGLILALARDDEQPRRGDRLVMIKGADHPWLLRPVLASDKEEEEYTFVGACREYRGKDMNTIERECSGLGDDEFRLV